MHRGRSGGARREHREGNTRDAVALPPTLTTGTNRGLLVFRTSRRPGERPGSGWTSPPTSTSTNGPKTERGTVAGALRSNAAALRAARLRMRFLLGGCAAVQARRRRQPPVCAAVCTCRTAHPGTPYPDESEPSIAESGRRSGQGPSPNSRGAGSETAGAQGTGRELGYDSVPGWSSREFPLDQPDAKTKRWLSSPWRCNSRTRPWSAVRRSRQRFRRFRQPRSGTSAAP